MPSDAAFRRSLYLTLALACACVGYAEADLLPEVPVLAACAVAALAILYHLETRVTLLSIPAANRLGLVVGLLNLAWAAIRIAQVAQRPDTQDANLQLVLVAPFGPLLVTLIPAKLARREQHVGDYWALQGMGLVGVCLSGAIEEDAVCGALIGLYALSAVWSLSLFFLRREAGAVRPIPNRPAPAPAGVVGPPGVPPRAGVRSALRLAGAAAAVAAPLYLVTPASPGEKLEFGKPRVEIGYAASQMVDLNQTGNLRENPAPAFEVEVEAADGLTPELPAAQLWRGRVLRTYSGGTWQPSDLPLPGVDGAPRTQLHWSPPRLGPGQVTLRFAVPAALAGQFLAEPVTWAADQPVPVASTTVNGPQPWLWGGDGSFLWSGRIRRNETHTYVQVWQPRAEPDLSPRFRLGDADPGSKVRPLLQNPVRRVKEYADGVVNRMVNEGRLPGDCRDPVTDLPRREFHDAVAKAFTAHLATAPGFTYTTRLRRARKDLDPIEEFLFVTRAGHCERFASALALMLRSQGVPAVLVLGFKGWEPTADPRKYLVRQEHAHAWVCALVTDYEPDAGDDPRERPVSRWRTLDPTPGGEPAADPGGGGAGEEARAWVREVVADAAAAVPAAGWRAIGFVSRWEVLALVGVGLVLALVRMRRARAVPVAPETTRLGRLFAVLAARGLVPLPGDTPREFAARAAAVLAASPATAAVAGVPAAWVDAYYEARFGGHVPSDERLDMLDTELKALARALHSAR
ncbi:Transglutaminase-like enzyme, predicted cysteine protease OS=Singulisphaera acidiphila (strain ATCC BAA-1392 / DSM 18658 / VKM B-2454 / MOB10) GN=Sinac_5893 PE=4 SV=1: Transglut_core: DUF4129 [Gemmataceae bacterium]|nr:Transglutaminase-like enzyme, predicted cysteine protease OS=Singulisphaera acidiphila (strain ATCC BAA-1392 / DSM 18658 / VKM B-2454 / MOB10) GN=Sinac_5893 PE=4 SV=1: Transglut_core: DUF4129 [Gemmataceae bacterium]VTU00301.1 Transglutaminase-like enzyme, predicted cysteine protease OS=Singulisphaera acidiphila (strain ATCC BAA-1392 / DSM 18658 / VKM B-2454 / MOB10) GN=Sinac_5893 PE=4 SV=1: Transglut_core: DUF4129 [Gemmataceae bacterium]